MLFNSKTKARKCMRISVQYNRKKQASSSPEGDVNMMNMIHSDSLLLDCFTDWSDTQRTGLTPAGKLPFHLHIEILGLDREKRARTNERVMYIKKEREWDEERERESDEFKDG